MLDMGENRVNQKCNLNSKDWILLNYKSMGLNQFELELNPKPRFRFRV
jgi:hypothetical protein